MALEQLGLIYYADDPDQKVFRIVHPTIDDSELDLPDAIQGKWTEFGIPEGRIAIMKKVAIDDPTALLNGSVNDPYTLNGEPI
ncbi:hypothetical protein UFOVP96_5 [uncultured Caudovirales phage]|uniref:Uncharacterized protein n=1 Tax=uncultured Caudovirales phage TaxID=2100421 RepID=A0A6J5L271_9CAUD|nr:hypothetical protein UFOVP96_5 [uncultured Caudovirales phage]